MTFLQLQSHIKKVVQASESAAPAYILYGADDFVKQRCVDFFAQTLSQDFADYNFCRMQIGEDELQQALDVADTFPMFDEFRVVVATLLCDFTEQDLDRYLKYIASPPQTTFLVILTNENFAKLLEKNGVKAISCAKLEGQALKSEVDRLLALPPTASITNDAYNELILRTQGFLFGISNEIDKLKAYCNGQITLAAVKELVSEDLDFKIYELASAVSEKNFDKALQVMFNFLENGYKPTTILAVLYDRFSKMLHLQLNSTLDNEKLGVLLNMKKGAVYYLRLAADKYTQVKLKKCVDTLHELQCDLLNGKRDVNSVAHEALLRLMAV